jgi:hypothetical protein
MLELIRRGRPEDRQVLLEVEDEALRRAFGRYARLATRPAGECVVRQRQLERGGQWFACDCLGVVPFPPVLVPVAETHVRRHVEGPWPQHAEDCDFFREAADQHAISASFARPGPSTGLKLVRGFGSGRPRVAGMRPVSVGRGRSALARLLLTLLETGGLTRIEPSGIRPMAAQFAALRQAAREIELEPGVRLSSFFCSYPPALPRLIQRVAEAAPSRFLRTGRPHGILAGLATAAAEGMIQPTQGDAFPVTGAISIFGETDGHAAGRAASGERAPYVMACVVGRAQPDGPVEVLRAYLQPCVSATWLLPVNSHFERRTVRQLVSLQRWVLSHDGAALIVEKPVFDLEAPVAVAAGGETDPHEPVIPDFIVRGLRGRCVVVETMGFDLPAYRDRKAGLHPAMSRACGGAPVVEHDFCHPKDWTQEERDRAFWRSCRQMLSGRQVA